MSLRLAAAAVATPRGLRRLFCTSSFIPPSTSLASPPLEEAPPSTNLFVSGLSKRTTTEKLREAFSQFGEVVHARVVTDRVLGYSKGFGFVRYATLEDAARGIEGMNGKNTQDPDPLFPRTMYSPHMVAHEFCTQDWQKWHLSLHGNANGIFCLKHNLL